MMRMEIVHTREKRKIERDSESPPSDFTAGLYMDFCNLTALVNINVLKHFSSFITESSTCEKPYFCVHIGTRSSIDGTINFSTLRKLRT